MVVMIVKRATHLCLKALKSCSASLCFTETTGGGVLCLTENGAHLADDVGDNLIQMGRINIPPNFARHKQHACPYCVSGAAAAIKLVYAVALLASENSTTQLAEHTALVKQAWFDQAVVTADLTAAGSFVVIATDGSMLLGIP
ncbi:unnamed protein product [Heligmosomoides polygyrus]|uniref:DUF3700 domain-containing protein n=1 Tax=Heligmosomoides polygyrus TaxID=6339 RepID=A0A183G2X1_HELPZ|nr:unnamed protein product [Heligmosomoides polygyrus]